MISLRFCMLAAAPNHFIFILVGNFTACSGCLLHILCTPAKHTPGNVCFCASLYIATHSSADGTTGPNPSAVPAAFCISLKNKLSVIVQYELFEGYKHNPKACINLPFMSNYSRLLQYGEVSFDSALGYRQSFRHLHWKSLRQVHPRATLRILCSDFRIANVRFFGYNSLHSHKLTTNANFYVFSMNKDSGR